MLRVHEWNRLLDVVAHAGTDAQHRKSQERALKLIRDDMDSGELAHRHLDDTALEAAVRRMGVEARRLPRDPGPGGCRVWRAVLAPLG